MRKVADKSAVCQAGSFANAWPLAAIAAMFAAATLPLGFVLNIWQDEAYTLHSTSRNLPFALHEAIVFEAQAPLYFLLLTVWRGINHSIFFARCFSIVCAIGAIGVVWTIARRRLPLMKATLPTLAFALNPFVVWAAVEVRLYALALLISALLVWTFCIGFLEGRHQWRFRIYHVLLAIAALYTQYYLGVYLVANLIVLAQRRAWRPFSQYCLCLAAVASAAIPLLAILPQQLAAFRGYPVSFNALRSAGIVAESVEFVLPRGWIANWTHEWQLNAIYILFVIAIAALILRRKHDREASQIFITMSVSIAICFFFVLFAFHQQLVVPRQTVALLIPSLFAVFALLGDTAQDRLQIWLIQVVYVASCAVSISEAYIPPIKPGDWRHVAEYVDANIRPGDTVALFNAEIVLPFQCYYARPNLVLPIPRPLNFDAAFDQRRFVIHNTQELKNAFAKPNRTTGHIWLITTDQSAKSVAYSGRPLLETFVRLNFNVDDTQKFVGTTVRELSRKQGRDQAGRAPGIVIHHAGGNGEAGNVAIPNV